MRNLKLLLRVNRQNKEDQRRKQKSYWTKKIDSKVKWKILKVREIRKLLSTKLCQIKKEKTINLN